MKFYKIDKKVVEDIVSLALAKSEEARIADREKLFGFLKLDPIVVRYTNNGVSISIYLKAIFSKNAIAVCEIVSKDIKTQIEKKLNLKVKDIFINLQGVYEP
ncbi:MAG: hypothetical protein WHS77_04915 [Brevinematales bacterium]